MGEMTSLPMKENVGKMRSKGIKKYLEFKVCKILGLRRKNQI